MFLPAEFLSVDSIRIVSVSERTDTVDGWGLAKLGDNFYNVLRERRSEVITTRVYAKFGFFPFVEVTQAIINGQPSLEDFLGAQPAVLTYLWWNNDSKEPIVNLTATRNGDVLAMNYKRALEATSTRGENTGQANVKLYPNPALDFVAYEVEGLPPGNYRVTLNNILGKQISVREFSAIGNQTKIMLDVSAYPSGQYFASLRNERGRIISARRLIVR